MSSASNIENARQLLEEIRERIGGFARQKALQSEVLDGLTRAMDLLAAPPAAGPSGGQGGPGELHKLHRALQARTRSNQAMISATDERQYLQDVCRIVVEDCGHAMVWIGYAENDEAKSVRPVAHSGFEEGYLETLNITWADTERGRGPTGTAIRSGKPCVCANMQQDPKFAPWRGEAVERGYASSAVLPLMDGDRTFGAISIYAREPDAFSQEEVALLSELARDLGFGVQSIRVRQARARSEELLRQSEERFRSIVELSPDAIFVNHNGRISYVNPAGIALFGAEDAGQIIGRTPFELFCPDCHAEMLERIETLLRGGSVPLSQARLACLDGTSREVEVAASLHSVPEGRAIQVVLRDVTGRKRAEERLARSLVEIQQRAGETEAVLAAMNDAVLVYDAGMNVVRANPGFIPTYGFDPTGLNVRELIARTRCRRLDGAPLTLEDQPTPRALKGEPVLNQQLRITKLDGQERVLETSATPLRVGGSAVGTVTVWHDITDRKRAEEALRESREDLNRAQSVAHMGSWRLNVRKNELLWSEENWRIFGVSPGTPLTYEVFLDTALPEDREYVHARWSAALRGEPYDIEHRIVVGDTVKWVRERAELEFDGDGQLLGGFGTTEDITERRRTQEALRESEERYRSLFNGMTEGFALHEIVLDESGKPCDYRFLDANPAFERLTGLKRDDIAGRLMREVLPEENPAWIATYGRVALTGEPVHFERYSPALQRWYAVFSYRPAPMQFAVIFMDVTERRQAQEALAKREEGLRQALRLGRSFAFEWDVATDEVVRGEECAEILGLSGSAALQETGASFFRRLHPDDLGALQDALQGLSPENDSYTVVYRVIRPDGSVVCLEEIARGTFDAQGALERLSGIAADVTERMRAQEALRRSNEELERRVDERTAELRAMNEALQREGEARKRAKEAASRLAAIVSSSDEAILSKTPDGIILTWNRGAERLLGYSEAEVVGRHVAFLTPEDRADETKGILDRIRRGECIERFETVRLRRDGSRVDVSLTVSPIFDAAGTLTGASEIAHDITERRRMDNELRRASEYSRSLIEASLDPLVTVSLDGLIADVNEATERMTGLARRDLIGSPYARCFTEPERMREGFARVLAEGMVTDFPIAVLHRSGGATDVLLNATVYRNGAGEVQGVFAAARDITRRKRAEQELARYRDQLEDLVRQRTGELEIAYQQLKEDIAARERLEAERLRLIDILEATPDMVSYSDASGRVLYFNHAARSILGIPPGVDLTEFDPPRGYPEWADRFLQEIAIPTAVLEGMWSGETAVLDAEGNEIPVSQVVIAHRDSSGQVAYFSTIARDVTAQKRAERELKALASFPSENPSPVMRTTDDGLLIYANESSERILDAWGCAAGDHVPPQVKKQISRALNRQKIQEAEYRVDGRVYSVLFAPMPETGHVNLYGRDITERRQVEDALVRARDELEQRVEDRTAELLQVNVALVNKIEEHARTVEALRKSQMRLAEAQRIAHLGGWEWDIRTGTLIWSDEVFRIFGLDPGGQAPTFPELLDWIPDGDRKLVERTALHAVAEKKPFSLDHRIVLQNGEVRHVHAQAEMVLDSAGASRRMLGTIMDITEHVRAEEEARIRQQQLVQADKMVSLGILVAGVAHEINNPNHSIMSNVSALAGAWESTRPILDRFYGDFGDFVLGGFEYSECRDKMPEMFANALANSKRIEVIVTELRDFARHSPKEDMAPVDVNAVVRSAIILMDNMVKKCTDHFSAACAADIPPVLGNFQRIEQVVINLIQNACQALASRDGLVRVATFHDTSSGSVVIEVCDGGAGIPEENMNQLGTPFFTTKRGAEGMGLGLWICSNIAHEHGGTLSFSSREGGGTRALLTLPANGHLAVETPVEYES